MSVIAVKRNKHGIAVKYDYLKADKHKSTLLLPTRVKSTFNQHDVYTACDGDDSFFNV